METILSKFLPRLGLFLLINFAALGIGGLLMGNGPSSDWYQALNKAPWTPPGWVFGAAWSFLMVCFAFYMAYLTGINRSGWVIGLFVAQFVFNVAWNPVFFGLHQPFPGLLIITVLTAIVATLLFSQWNLLGWKNLLILPYLLWLIIASSLNTYVVAYN